MKIIVYKNEVKEEKQPDYRELVIKKIKDLGCFEFEFSSIGDYLFRNNPIANGDYIIILGFLQILLKDIAYFGYNSNIYLKIYQGNSWQDVYNVIKDIDSLDYEVRE